MTYRRCGYGFEGSYAHNDGLRAILATEACNRAANVLELIPDVQLLGVIMARACTVCEDADFLLACAEMARAGATNVAIAAALGIGREAVRRHRVNHAFVSPGKIRARKQSAVQEPEVKDDTPASAKLVDLTVTGIGELYAEAVAAIRAELDACAGRPGQVVALANSLMKAADGLGRLGAVGGYAPGQIASAGGTFKVVINIGTARETISASPLIDGSPVREAELIDQ